MHVEKFKSNIPTKTIQIVMSWIGYIHNNGLLVYSNPIFFITMN